MALPAHTFQFEECDARQFPTLKPLLQTNENSAGCLARLIERYLWDPALIVREAIAFDPDALPGVGGIYFLVHGKRIVYVGFSRCLVNRLAQHRESTLTFERLWCFGGMPEAFATEIEAFYIHATSPPLNNEIPYLADDLRNVLDDLQRGKRQYTYA